ncbi:MAG: hypothetical protein KKC37_01005, partial [Proteobacteria bacterium]|nr:hypothetical protein [Pseudomonadota bacterium]
ALALTASLVGSAAAISPQPLPPTRQLQIRSLGPQPEPPDSPGWRGINPQPEPPGISFRHGRFNPRVGPRPRHLGRGFYRHGPSRPVRRGYFR